MRHSTHRVRFFFNDTATTEIYTLSLHDALPIFLLVDDRPENLLALEAVLAPLPCRLVSVTSGQEALRRLLHDEFAVILLEDRKSTRLNSSHANISYAVFCLKKKKQVLLHLSQLL